MSKHDEDSRDKNTKSKEAVEKLTSSVQGSATNKTSSYKQSNTMKKQKSKIKVVDMMDGHSN